MSECETDGCRNNAAPGNSICLACWDDHQISYPNPVTTEPMSDTEMSNLEAVLFILKNYLDFAPEDEEFTPVSVEFLRRVEHELNAHDGKVAEKKAFWAAFEIARMNSDDSDIQKHWNEYALLKSKEK